MSSYVDFRIQIDKEVDNHITRGTVLLGINRKSKTNCSLLSFITAVFSFIGLQRKFPETLDISFEFQKHQSLKFNFQFIFLYQIKQQLQFIYILIIIAIINLLLLWFNEWNARKSLAKFFDRHELSHSFCELICTLGML